MERQKKLNEKIAGFIKKETNLQMNILKNIEKFQRNYSEDYFIHKNLKEFLLGQLKIYINQEIIDVDSILTSKGDIKQHIRIIALIMNEISINIIEKLSLLEDIKKKLWEKKKFVINTDYCITLDYIDEKYYPTILNNTKQLQEWKDLFSFDLEKEISALKGKINYIDKEREEIKIEVLKNNPTLSIDTKFYNNDFKCDILCQIENLDEKITGILLHSDNYHALNLLMNKYEKSIKCCYIDPPYNAKSSKILYKNNYEHSSWLSLMENRIYLVKKTLSENGVLIIAIDENEADRLALILDQNFEDNFDRTSVVIIHNPRGIQGKGFSYCHEFANFIFPKNLELSKRKLDNIKEKPLMKTGSESERYTAKNCFYPIIVKNNNIIELGLVPKDEYHPNGPQIIREDGSIELWPICTEGKERKWRYTANSLRGILDQVSIRPNRQGQFVVYLGKEEEAFKTVWDSAEYNAAEYGSTLLKNIIPDNNFTFPKSLYTVKDCLKIGYGDKSGIVIDFFAGSGTTGHALLEMNGDGINRKFILVEAEFYFEQVLKKRIMRIIYSNNWVNGIPQNNVGFKKQIIKYHEIEQYEDALENVQFKQLRIDSFDNYGKLLQYYLEDGIDTNKSKNFLGVDTEKEFLDLKIKVLNKDGTTRDQNVDLIETFNYLIGIEVQQMKKLSNEGMGYYIITGMVKENSAIIIWRDPKVNKEKDKEFINKILQEKSYKEIYVNSDCLIKNYKNIYDEMRKRLW